MNNYILPILSFALFSLFAFLSYFIIIFFTLDFYRYARAYRACVQVATLATLLINVYFLIFDMQFYLLASNWITKTKKKIF